MILNEELDKFFRPTVVDLLQVLRDRGPIKMPSPLRGDGDAYEVLEFLWEVGVEFYVESVRGQPTNKTLMIGIRTPEKPEERLEVMVHVEVYLLDCANEFFRCYLKPLVEQLYLLIFAHRGFNAYHAYAMTSA